jgi:hypothetical protein
MQRPDAELLRRIPQLSVGHSAKNFEEGRGIKVVNIKLFLD